MARKPKKTKPDPLAAMTAAERTFAMNAIFSTTMPEVVSDAAFWRLEPRSEDPEVPPEEIVTRFRVGYARDVDEARDQMQRTVLAYVKAGFNGAAIQLELDAALDHTAKGTWFEPVTPRADLAAQSAGRDVTDVALALAPPTEMKREGAAFAAYKVEVRDERKKYYKRKGLQTPSVRAKTARSKRDRNH